MKIEHDDTRAAGGVIVGFLLSCLAWALLGTVLRFTALF